MVNPIDIWIRSGMVYSDACLCSPRRIVEALNACDRLDKENLLQDIVAISCPDESTYAETWNILLNDLVRYPYRGGDTYRHPASIRVRFYAWCCPRRVCFILNNRFRSEG